MKKTDEFYMQKCFELARRGASYVSPNPMVGAVIVKKGKILGVGYHKKFGDAHAEINAIRNAKGNLRGAKLYVNLEPCCYYGKTHPCTETIIKAGFQKVVVGTTDPNPLVRGKGIKQLRKAGIKVHVGVLQEQSKQLNETFLKYITTKIPFVTLKIAQTLNGKIASFHNKPRWITSKESRRLVHQLRAEHDAVLVGANTVRVDNPELTVRLVKGHNPIRILLDGNLSVPLRAKLFSDHFRQQTVVFAANRNLKFKKNKLQQLRKRGVKMVFLQSDPNGLLKLKSVLRELGKMNISSILVEGGQHIFTSFLTQYLVDKLLIFIAPKIFTNGLPALGMSSLKRFENVIELSNAKVFQVGKDILIESYRPS